MPEIPYIPGLSFGVARAWDAYRSAWSAEDTAADLCPANHAHPDGDRIEFEGQCQDTSPAGRLHAATQSALAGARRLHDYLKELEVREADGRAQDERDRRAAVAAARRAADDDLTALAAAVFAAADATFTAGTVRGRTAAEQKRADANAPTGGWRA